MAAIVRQCSRVTLRSLTAFSLRSRPAQQAVLSPLLRKNLKVEWKVDLSSKYFCSYTQTVIDNPNSATTSAQSGQSEVGAISSESDESELISSSSNDLHHISQRLGSVRHEETLLQAFQVIKNAEERDVPPLLVYQLIRNCGNQLFTCMPEERTKLVKRFWSELKEKGIHFDVSHYNVLLSVYLQNYHSFSPVEILEEMKSGGVEPNQTTLVLFIQAFCENGDMIGSLEMLGMMKTLDIPVTEQVYASLITGYSRSGDMESALGIMETMRGNGLEPGLDTYISLLIAYSEAGDLENIKKVVAELTAKKGMCPVGVTMAIVEALARAKHHTFIPEILREMNINQSVFNSELINVLKGLIARGLHENALELLKVIPRNHMVNSERLSVPEVEFMRQLVLSIQEPKMLVSMLKKVDDAKILKSPYELSLNFSYGKHDKALSLAIIETMAKKGLTVRPHYFYPMMVDAIRNNDGKGAIETLSFIRQRNLRLDNNLIYYGKKALKWENKNPQDVIRSLQNIGEDSHQSKETALHLFTDRLDLAEIKGLIEASGDVVENEALIPCLELLIKRDDRTEDAVEAILFAEKKGLDVENCVYTLINRISRTRKASRKLIDFMEILFEKNINAGSRVFSRVLSSLSKDDTTGEFFEFLRILKRNDVEPDASSYREILKKSSNMGRKEAAEFAFTKVNEVFPDDPVAYSYLLLAYAKNNVGNLGFTTDFKNRTKISAIFDEMVEKGLKPFDAAVSHAIIAHLTKGNIEMADKIKEKYGTGSRVFIVYTQYLRFFAKKGDVHNSERIISEMKEMDTDMSPYTYNYLSQAYRKHGDVEKIKKLIDEMKAKNIDKIFMNYSELMMAQLKWSDVEGAWEVYQKECQSLDKFPSYSCCVHLMRELGSSKDIAKLDELSTDITKSKALPEHEKNTMRHSLVVAYLDADAEGKIKEIVDREDFKHEYNHYRSVARNAAGIGKVELLRKLMSFLEEQDLKSTVLYQPLLYAYGKQNDMTGAYALRDEIIAKGETLSPVFLDLFEKLAENRKKDVKIVEEPSQPENVN
ncbi:Leucine-rich PPR motif-containing, mitochondrial [Paramuricea clavata]|uniref:Leucine-rich PPR motif-containing, mitochondrial n=1 Tax=Paramuricea clavata TaxID=317549 RepID=A0A7D9HIC4_PARCT|nr:Leucine-rich PPR motif-containing, mitochondrial [Paramuricea clavata]